MSPKVSICIPTYCEREFLDIAIKSCLTQTFRDFEIIISDDTPDASIETFASVLVQKDQRIKYFRNPGPHGAAANSNHAVTKSSGDWIKFLYQDDQFADQNSLSAFVEATELADFVFSPCIQSKGDSSRIYQIDGNKYQQLLRDPVWTLLEFGNIIGAPSATMIKKDKFVPFDLRMTWRFDHVSYLQALANGANIICLATPAIKIVEHSRQLTEKVKNNNYIDFVELMMTLKYLLDTEKYSDLAKRYCKRFIVESGTKLQFDTFMQALKTSKMLSVSACLFWLEAKLHNIYLTNVQRIKRAARKILNIGRI